MADRVLPPSISISFIFFPFYRFSCNSFPLLLPSPSCTKFYYIFFRAGLTSFLLLFSAVCEIGTSHYAPLAITDCRLKRTSTSPSHRSDEFIHATALRGCQTRTPGAHSTAAGKLADSDILLCRSV